jgi:hypothetical protein
MIVEANINTEESSKSEIPEVPDEAIVEPGILKTVKMTKRPGEELPGDENKHGDEMRV